MILLFTAFCLLLSVADVYAQAKVTWTCDRCSTTTGSATITDTPAGVDWTLDKLGINYAIGRNIVTVTATDSNGVPTTDTITVNYAPAFPGATLAGAWGFEGNFSDSSGNNNNGTAIAGASITAQGHSRQGLTLNGTSQYVLVNNSASLQFTQSFSFSAWVNPAASYTNWRSVVSKNGIGGLYASSSGTGCGAGAPAIYFYINGDSSQEFVACSTTLLQVNQWSHLEGTYDNAAGQLKLYLNGALAPGAFSTIAATGYIDYNAPDMTLQIGSSEFSNEFFHGVLDEVRVYNWGIPLAAGSNTTPGAACVFGDPLSTAEQAVIRDMNCPVIRTEPPLEIKFPAGATDLKISKDAVIKFGGVP